MSDSIEKKILSLKNTFTSLTPEERYKRLIEMGRALSPLSRERKTAENVVPGCQSTLYLYASLQDKKMLFESASDALISAGLAALLLEVYSGESPETVLTYPPHFLEELNITASLSPNRSNGLVSIHLRMKQLALSFLVSKL